MSANKAFDKFHKRFRYLDRNDARIAKGEDYTGPSEKAPYTHWMPIPQAPNAVLKGSK